MDIFIDILKSIVLGIVEGITEWLPISSTGHMILVDELLHLNVSDEFKELFFVVIQLGAILAVILLFFKKIWPFHTSKTEPEVFFKSDLALARFSNKYVYMSKIILWLKILVASVPAAILGIAFNSKIDEMLTGDMRAVIVSAALIVYGVIFIVIESRQRNSRINSLENLSYKNAFLIGVIQCLSLVPGTSRSGSTILGAMLLGVSRVTAAEFSFFLSIPAMCGGTLIDALMFIADGNTITSAEWLILAVGTVVSFIVSVIIIKFLMSYIRKHDFKVFGWYRIVLGIIVLAYFLIKK